jgi:hypothetical protein
LGRREKVLQVSREVEKTIITIKDAAMVPLYHDMTRRREGRVILEL